MCVHLPCLGPGRNPSCMFPTLLTISSGETKVHTLMTYGSGDRARGPRDTCLTRVRREADQTWTPGVLSRVSGAGQRSRAGTQRTSESGEHGCPPKGVDVPGDRGVSGNASVLAVVRGQGTA